MGRPHARPASGTQCTWHPTRITPTPATPVGPGTARWAIRRWPNTSTRSGASAGSSSAGSVVAAVVAYLIALTLTPRFEASAVLMVTASKTGEQVATSGLDVRNFRAFVQNQTLAAEVIKEFGLRTTPQRFLDNNVNVQDVRATNLLTVSVTAPDPQLAARIANAMAARAVGLSRSVEQAESVVARDVIKGQLDAARERLTQSRAALETYQREAQVELLEKRINVLTEQQAEIQTMTVDIEGQRAYLRQAEHDLAQQDRVRGVQRSVQLQEPRAVDDDARRERERSATEADRQRAQQAARASDQRLEEKPGATAMPAPEPPPPARPRYQEPEAEPPARAELRDAPDRPLHQPVVRDPAAAGHCGALARGAARTQAGRDAEGALVQRPASRPRRLLHAQGAAERARDAAEAGREDLRRRGHPLRAGAAADRGAQRAAAGARPGPAAGSEGLSAGEADGFGGPGADLLPAHRRGRWRSPGSRRRSLGAAGRTTPDAGDGSTARLGRRLAAARSHRRQRRLAGHRADQAEVPGAVAPSRHARAGSRMWIRQARRAAGGARPSRVGHRPVGQRPAHRAAQHRPPRRHRGVRTGRRVHAAVRSGDLRPGVLDRAAGALRRSRPG